MSSRVIARHFFKTMLTSGLLLASGVTVEWSASVGLHVGFKAARADVRYVYDASGRLTSATDSAGNTITYTYDADGNVISVTSTNPATGSAGVVIPAASSRPVSQ